MTFSRKKVGEGSTSFKLCLRYPRLAEEIGLQGELWQIQAASGELCQKQGEENIDN